jgi:hypothetical protein
MASSLHVKAFSKYQTLKEHELAQLDRVLGKWFMEIHSK